MNGKELRYDDMSTAHFLKQSIDTGMFKYALPI